MGRRKNKSKSATNPLGFAEGKGHYHLNLWSFTPGVAVRKAQCWGLLAAD